LLRAVARRREDVPTRAASLEPSNNVRCALRPAVLWRKGISGSHGEANCRFAMRLLIVAATCRQYGRGLLDVLGAEDVVVWRDSKPPPLLAAL
jgi:hypothetical protein